MKPEECIFFQLAKASQSATRYWSRMVETLGITAAQAMVMNFLGEEDGILSRELGERTGLDSATLTGLIDRLEKMGLVERQPVHGDRRAISICLTEEGRALTLSLRNLMIEANETFLLGVRASDEARFRDLLKHFRSEANELASNNR